MIEHITIGLCTHHPLKSFPGTSQPLLHGWIENIGRLKIVDEIFIIEMLDEGEGQQIIPGVISDYRCRIVSRLNKPPMEITRKETLQFIKNDWVLFLDDDERMSEGMIYFLESLAIEDVKSPAGRTLVAGEDYAAIRFTREDYIFYNGLWRYIPANGNDPQIRLMDRRRACWYGRVHETPEIDGTILSVQNPNCHILHYRSYEKIVQKTNLCNELFQDQAAIVHMQTAYVERVKGLIGVSCP